MMYIHFCQKCSHIFILNGHKNSCPKCASSLTELKMSYMDYTALSEEQRKELMRKCADEQTLRKLSTSYRMSKYRKDPVT